jgi:hypothetical protein
MAFFRNFFLVIASILFFVFVLAGNVFLTLSMSLDYDVVRPQVSSTFKGILSNGKDMLADNTNNVSEWFFDVSEAVLQTHCMNNNTEYIFEQKSYTITIPCEAVMQGMDFMIDAGVESVFEATYYQEYDCDFWNCFENSEYPFFLVSEKAQKYWQGKYYYSLLISAILLVLMFFLVVNKRNFFIISGGILILASLPFLKLAPFFSFLDDNILQFLNIFISKAGTVFLGCLSLGIVLLAIGLLWHFFHFGKNISKKISEAKNKTKIESKELSKK